MSTEYKAHTIIARTYSGGKDLYYDLPSLEGARIVKVTHNRDNSDYITNLILVDPNGTSHILQIRQEME